VRPLTIGCAAPFPEWCFTLTLTSPIEGEEIKWYKPDILVTVFPPLEGFAVSSAERRDKREG